MYRRRFRAGTRGRFSRFAREATVVDMANIDLTGSESGYWANCVVVPAVTGQGNRRLSSLVARFCWAVPVPIPFVIAYCPSGIVPSKMGDGGFSYIDNSGEDGTANIHTGISSLYEPNQNVLTSGVIAPNGQEVTTVSWSGTRTLGSGDTIVIVFKNYLPSQQVQNKSGICMVSFTVGY